MLPRLYREAPVNAIWEGSGNVMCLDLLRALSREGEAALGVLAGLAEATADLPGTETVRTQLAKLLATANAEAHARYAVEQLALLAAAAALRTHAPVEIAEAFAHAQFGARSSMFGSAAVVAPAKVLERALPA
jgi:putative acyl-CoA dehydrogenase